MEDKLIFNGTPGKWEYHETPNDVDFVGEIHSGNSSICAIYVGDNKADYDAQLISNAPELFEALKESQAMMSGLIDFCYDKVQLGQLDSVIMQNEKNFILLHKALGIKEIERKIL